MLKTAKEMNKIAGDVREARIARARAEAEMFVNETLSKKIEREAENGAYKCYVCVSKWDVNVSTVVEMLKNAGYKVNEGTEVLTIIW